MLPPHKCSLYSCAEFVRLSASKVRTAAADPLTNSAPPAVENQYLASVISWRQVCAIPPCGILRWADRVASGMLRESCAGHVPEDDWGNWRSAGC